MGTDERRRAIDALRVVIQRLVATGAPEDELAAAADALDGLARRLEPHQLDDRFGDADMLETHPIIGPSNPLTPPLTCTTSDGRAVVTGMYTQAYEGIPGRLHGGFIAAGFDVALGRAVAGAGRAAVTGTLTIRYRKPVPLFVPVRYVGEIGTVSGRKITCSATLTVEGEDEILAEAQGLWIVVGQQVFQAE